MESLVIPDFVIPRIWICCSVLGFEKMGFGTWQPWADNQKRPSIVYDHSPLVIVTGLRSDFLGTLPGTVQNLAFAGFLANHFGNILFFSLDRSGCAWFVVLGSDCWPSNGIKSGNGREISTMFGCTLNVHRRYNFIVRLLPAEQVFV
jgi:hypothetical protein